MNNNIYIKVRNLYDIDFIMSFNIGIKFAKNNISIAIKIGDFKK